MAKAVRRVWNLPYTAQSNILPLLARCPPKYDEICKRPSHTDVRLTTLLLLRILRVLGVLDACAQSPLERNEHISSIKRYGVQ
jgi:hypothetical protein